MVFEGGKGFVVHLRPRLRNNIVTRNLEVSTPGQEGAMLAMGSVFIQQTNSDAENLHVGGATNPEQLNCGPSTMVKDDIRRKPSLDPSHSHL